MSTRELAVAARVSLATVVRFPRLLRYPTFDALRSSIQDRVNLELTGVERLKTVTGSDHTPAAVLSRIIERDCESLRSLAQTFSDAELERFSARLLRSERVHIVGARYVAPLATYFAYLLGKLKPNVEPWTQVDSSLFDRVHLMNKREDVMVAITLPRYPADFMRLLGYASKRGIPILAITDSRLSPVVSLAEATLLARASTLDFVGSLAPAAALINCVVNHIGFRMGRRALDRLQRLEDAAAEAGIYVKSNGQAESAMNGNPAWSSRRNRKIRTEKN
jgi:DNA-binding MurR/RpiR family transcriptional regulator